MSQEQDPATICAALAPLLLEERRTRIDAAVAARLGGLRVVIENLHDPHNGAAVLRSAEAFGVQRVDVIESFEPFRYSSTVTQGCEKWLDVVRHKDEFAALAPLTHEQFMQIGIGLVSAFVVSLVVVHLFMGWVRKHGFIPFAIYRIVLGGVLLYLVMHNRL